MIKQAAPFLEPITNKRSTLNIYTMKKLLFLLPGFLLPAVAGAQEKAALSTAGATSGNFYMEILIGAFIITALMILMAALAMLKAFKVISRELTNPTPYIPAPPIEPQEYEAWKEAKQEKPGIW